MLRRWSVEAKKSITFSFQCFCGWRMVSVRSWWMALFSFKTYLSGKSPDSCSANPAYWGNSEIYSRNFHNHLELINHSTELLPEALLFELGVSWYRQFVLPLLKTVCSYGESDPTMMFRCFVYRRNHFWDLFTWFCYLGRFDSALTSAVSYVRYISHCTDKATHMKSAHFVT